MYRVFYSTFGTEYEADFAFGSESDAIEYCGWLRSCGFVRNVRVAFAPAAALATKPASKS